MAGNSGREWMLTEAEIEASYTPVNHMPATHKLTVDQIQEIVAAANRRLVEWMGENIFSEDAQGPIRVERNAWLRLRAELGLE